MKLKSLALMGSLLFLVACAEEEKKACSAVEVADFNAMQLVCNPPEIFTAQPAGPEGEKIKMSVLLLEKENKEKCAAAMDSYINKYGNYSCRAKKVQSGDVFTISSTKLKKKASKIKIEMASIEADIKNAMSNDSQVNTKITIVDLFRGVDENFTNLSKEYKSDDLYKTAEERYNSIESEEISFSIRSNRGTVIGSSRVQKSNEGYLCIKTGAVTLQPVYSYRCYVEIDADEMIYNWVENKQKEKSAYFDKTQFNDYRGKDGKVFERIEESLLCQKHIKNSIFEKRYRCFSKIKYEDDKVLDEKVEAVIDSEVQSEAQENEQEVGLILNDKNIEDPKVPVAPMGSAPESPIMQ